MNRGPITCAPQQTNKKQNKTRINQLRWYYWFLYFSGSLDAAELIGSQGDTTESNESLGDWREVQLICKQYYVWTTHLD